MHSSIYLEFDVSLAPIGEHSTCAQGTEPVLYVKLREKVNGKDHIFKLIGGVGSPERWIEEQVLRRFPESNAAQVLRHAYGLTLHTLKLDWHKAFGERLYAGLVNRPAAPESKGALYWEALIPSLPAVLYTAMNTRAVHQLKALPETTELRVLVKATHDAWLSVLQEAQGISFPLTGLARLGLEMNGWDTIHLRYMSLLELGQFKEKAHFANLALSFLTDEDWVHMLRPILISAE